MASSGRAMRGAAACPSRIVGAPFFVSLLFFVSFQPKQKKKIMRKAQAAPALAAAPLPLVWPPREAGLGSEIGAICQGRSPSNGAAPALQACSAEPAAPGLCCGESTGHAIYKYMA